jgi:hypothetical protein
MPVKLSGFGPVFWWLALCALGRKAAGSTLKGGLMLNYMLGGPGEWQIAPKALGAWHQGVEKRPNSVAVRVRLLWKRPHVERRYFCNIFIQNPKPVLGVSKYNFKPQMPRFETAGRRRRFWPVFWFLAHWVEMWLEIP